MSHAASFTDKSTASLTDDYHVNQTQQIEDNRHFLLAFVEYVKLQLAQAYGKGGSEGISDNAHGARLEHLFKREIVTPLPIDHLSHLYQLTNFEQQLLLLCIAPELDSELLLSPWGRGAHCG